MRLRTGISILTFALFACGGSTAPAPVTAPTTTQDQTESPDVDGLRARVATLCTKRPLYPGFRGYTTYVA